MDYKRNRRLFGSALLMVVCQAQVPAKVNPKCLVKNELRFAGIKEGEYLSDMDKLEEFMTTDWRIWGFQVCVKTDASFNYLNSFRLYNSEDYGLSDYIAMTPIGPGTENCTRPKIADPKVDVVKSIEMFTAEIVTGVNVTLLNTATGIERVGSWGYTDVRDSTIITFDYVNQPLIGIYGYQGVTLLNGVGFITYDLSDECQRYVEPVPEPEPEEPEPDPTPDPDDTEVVVVDPVDQETD